MFCFAEAKVFNQPLSFNTSLVTNMDNMFNGATSFNKPLNKWNVSSVTDMKFMFADANSFQQTLCGAAWVKSKASKTDMFDESPGSISKAVCGAWLYW